MDILVELNCELVCIVQKRELFRYAIRCSVQFVRIGFVFVSGSFGIPGDWQQWLNNAIMKTWIKHESEGEKEIKKAPKMEGKNKTWKGNQESTEKKCTETCEKNDLEILSLRHCSALGKHRRPQRMSAIDVYVKVEKAVGGVACCPPAATHPTLFYHHF